MIPDTEIAMMPAMITATISVMVVDDEYLLRSLIIRSVDWTAIGLEVVCEASDGEEALTAIEIYHPAIAIVDINMPFINGLELTRIISEKYPHMQVIILTGYSEFEYAREAIRARAVNYITKPIDVHELTDALIAAGNAARNLLEDAKLLSKLQTEAYRGRIAEKDEYLRRLFHDLVHDPEKQIKTEFSKLGCTFEQEGYLVVIISLDQIEDNCQDSKGAIHYQYAIANIAQEVLRENRTCEALIEVDLTIVLLVGVDSSQDDEDIRRIEQDCRRIVSLSEQYFDLQPTVSIGSCQRQLHNVPVSFRTAVSLLNSRFYRPDRILIWKHELESSSLENRRWFVGDTNMIMTELRLGNGSRCLLAIEEIFANVAEEMIPKEYAKSIALNLNSVCFSFMTEKDIKIADLSFKEISTQISTSTSVIQLRQLILNLYTQTLEQIRSDNNLSNLHPMVRKALTEIEQHYSSSQLSLDLIAKSVFVNPSYLSSIFRKEIGITLIEYVIEYRLSMARRMIVADVRRDIGEIAAAVGYSDVYYFSRCFKKHFGVAPTHYWLAFAQNN